MKVELTEMRQAQEEKKQEEVPIMYQPPQMHQYQPAMSNHFIPKIVAPQPNIVIALQQNY